MPTVSNVSRPVILSEALGSINNSRKHTRCLYRQMLKPSSLRKVAEGRMMAHTSGNISNDASVKVWTASGSCTMLRKPYMSRPLEKGRAKRRIEMRRRRITSTSPKHADCLRRIRPVILSEALGSITDSGKRKSFSRQPNAQAFLAEVGGRRPDDGRALAVTFQMEQASNARGLPTTDYRLLNR